MELSKELNISRNTLRQAINRLVFEGAAHPQERIWDDRGAPERDEQRPQLDELFAGDACPGHGRAEFRTGHQPQDAARRGFRVSQCPGRSQAAVPGAPARTP